MNIRDYKEKLLKTLKRPNTRLKFRDLKRILSVNNETLERIIGEVRREGYQIVYGKVDHCYWLSTVPTPYSNIYDMSFLPHAGKIGSISDTHICSDAERLDLCEVAYDIFVHEGITTVFHSGDLTDGWNVYRGHSQFVKVAGAQKQAKYCLQHYPKRDGVKTYVCAGNHDLKSYLENGVDQVSLVVNGFDLDGKHYDGRSDIVYLGQHSRYVKLPQEITVQLLHPHGGDVYAKSYLQQKRAWAMSQNTQPDIQISGHTHCFCWIVEDTVQMISMPGMQDETEFFKRKGFQRQMGFCIIEYVIEDTRLTRLKVEMIPLS